MASFKSRLIDFLTQLLQDELGRCESAEARQTLEKQHLVMRFLPRREQAPTDPIAAGTLVQIEHRDRKSWVLMMPSQGGVIAAFDGQPVQALSPDSPLGSALLGGKLGQEVLVAGREEPKKYAIRQVL